MAEPAQCPTGGGTTGTFDASIPGDPRTSYYQPVPSGSADWTATYGNPGDTPIVGDWDGDGRDTVGVYRDGVFYLRNSNTTGVADITVHFGNPGDIPLAGKWTRLFTSFDPFTVPPDTVGVDRNGEFYLRNSNTDGVADVTFSFGNPDDIPVVGNWAGTWWAPSHDSIALVRHVPPGR